MSDVKPIAPVRIGHTDIIMRTGMRAGSWLFFTGHEASDFEHGIAAEVAGKPGLPLGGAAALSARRQIHLRPIRKADRRGRRQPSPHRARRPVLSARRMRESRISVPARRCWAIMSRRARRS